MTFRAHKSIFILALTGAVSCGALTSASAQTGGSAQTTGNIIRPYKQVRGPRAVISDTRRMFPQIRQSMRFEEKGEKNPTTPPWHSGGQPNTLPVGGSNGQDRVTRLALFPGIDDTGSWPPDPQIAVGPNHIVAVVNSDIAFFNKSTGAKIFQQPMGASGFFAGMGVTAFDFDPKAFYDHVTGRFFVMTLELQESSETSKVLVAVSDDSDPNGVWRKYRIEAKMVDGGTSSWMDYEGFACNKDAVVICGNMFGFTSGFTGFNQQIVISKAQLLTGASPTISYLKTPTYTIQAGISPDPTADRIYMASLATNSSITLYALTNLTTTPTLTSTTLAIPSFSFPPAFVPSQGGSGLSTVAGTLHSAQSRFNRLYTAHTIAGSNGTQVRWYEFSMNNWPGSGQNPTLRQSGNVTPPSSTYYNMPAIGVNKFEDITLIFTRSSNSIAADIMTAGRRKTDPLGSMGNVKLMASSPASGFDQGRWGDYFNVQIDPNDDVTFWGVGMLVKGQFSWKTEIVKWQITPPGGASGIPVAPTSVTFMQGDFATGTLASLLNADNMHYTIRTNALTKLGQVGAFETTYTLAQGADNIDGLTLKYEGSGTEVGGTVFVYLWNNNTGVYDQVKAFALKGVDTATNIELAPFGLSKYLDGSLQMKILIRALMPRRFNMVPSPFDFNSDLIGLSVVYK